MSFRIVFNILPLVFKALTGQAPAFIRDLLLPYEPERCLRSAGTALLMVPRSRLITKGDRATLHSCGTPCPAISGRQLQ